jgi:hypothetical protein
MSPIKNDSSGDTTDLQPRTLDLESAGDNGGSNNENGGSNTADGNGQGGSNTADGDDNEEENPETPKKKRFQPTPVLQINGQFIRGSEDDLVDGGEDGVTEICYPLHGPLDHRLKNSKKRKLDFVEETVELLLKKIKAADPADAHLYYLAQIDLLVFRCVCDRYQS